VSRLAGGLLATGWTLAQLRIFHIKNLTRKPRFKNWISLHFDDWDLLSGVRELSF
jgi:hypothetical protein